MNESTGEPIGYIIGGGLKEGFNIRLTVRADTVQEGSFVVCDNGRYPQATCRLPFVWRKMSSILHSGYEKN